MNLLIKTLAALAACTVFATRRFRPEHRRPHRQRARAKIDRASRRFPVRWPGASSTSRTRWRTCASCPWAGRLQATCLRASVICTSRVDDLPWFWADYGQSNTIILGGLPRGQHKVLIEVVDPEGKVFTGQTVTFYTPGTSK